MPFGLRRAIGNWLGLHKQKYRSVEEEERAEGKKE